MVREKKPVVYTRVEKDGKVAYTEGKRVLMVPAPGSCRERLTRLLEQAGGDPTHELVTQFWKDRARDMGDLDAMKREWATECFLILEKIWDELITPPEQDAFKAFGI